MAIGYDYCYQQEVIRLSRLNKKGGGNSKFWKRYTQIAAALIRVIWPCDIDPNATIGKVNIPHAVGIVIGSTAVIEDDVLVMSGVVIGGKYGKDGRHGHAHVKQGAILGANSVILGPITVGEHAKIGAGAVITKDVPAYATVVGNNRIVSIDNKE